MIDKILITGKMRSGTTFLANFLNSQVEGVIYSDFLRSPLILAPKLKIKDLTAPLSSIQKNILSAELEAEFKFNGFTITVNRDEFSTWLEFYDLAFDRMLSNHGTSKIICVLLESRKQRKYTCCRNC